MQIFSNTCASFETNSGGARDGSGNWAQVAQRTFSGALQVKYGAVSTPNFQQPSSATYAGSVSATVSGSGYLTGNAPSSDSVITVENGSVNIANNASVSALRTGIVLTGNNTFASSVNFPTGNGQSASLSLSAPTDSSNPWQGVAFYQDPKLTYQVDNRWGPGATFSADGLVHLGNSNVVTDGSTGSNNSPCSKFVMNKFHHERPCRSRSAAAGERMQRHWPQAMGRRAVVHLTR